MKIRKYPIRKGLLFIWRYLNPYRRILYLILFLTAIMSIIGAIGPYIFGLVVDSYLGNPIPFDLGPFVLLVIWAIFTLVEILADRYSMQKLLNLSAITEKELIVDVSAHVLNLPLSYHYSQRPGVLFKKVNRASDNMGNIIESIGFGFVPSLIMMFFSIVLMAWVNWRMALIFLVGLIIFSVIAIFYKLNEVTLTKNRVNESYNLIWGQMGDFITNIFSVKTNTAEKYELKRENKSFEKALFHNRHLFYLWNKVAYSYQTILSGTRIIVVFIATYFLIKQKITPGEFTMFVSYLALVLSPIWWLADQYRRLKTMVVDI